MEKPTYDPNKNYIWSKDDKFTLSGQEFGVILNSLRAILAQTDAQIILLADKAQTIIESALARGVEEGTVKEKENGKEK